TEAFKKGRGSDATETSWNWGNNARISQSNLDRNKLPLFPVTPGALTVDKCYGQTPDDSDEDMD
ncbi:hypothetical protein BGZ65_007604, partial [Modicella reniformis]